MKNDFEDVSLSDGLAYMAPRKEFDRYIQQAESLKPDARAGKERQEVCNFSSRTVWSIGEMLFNRETNATNTVL